MGAQRTVKRDFVPIPVDPDRLGLPLTPRMLQVARAYARNGMSVKLTAYELGVHYQTVKNQLTSAYRRLGVESGGEMMLALGWLKVPAVHTHVFECRDCGVPQAVAPAAVA